MRQPWIVFAALVAVGCSEVEDVSSIDETLSAFDWTQDFEIDDGDISTALGPAVAPIGTGAVMVYVQRCRLGCPQGLKWSYYASGTWSGAFEVPSATSTAQPSLAAFNGYVYMIYASGTDQYMARFDPARPANFGGSQRLPFSSLGAAAIASYGGKLVIVRADPATSGRLYWRTMDTTGQFSAEQPIVRAIDGSGCATTRAASAPNLAVGVQYYEYAQSTPALATFGNCLYIAHRDGATTTLVYNTFGGTWGTQLAIPNGPGGAPQTSSLQPALGTFQGALHIVYPAASGDIVWSYLDASGWALAQALANHDTRATPSLAALSDRLLMVHAAVRPPVEDGVWYASFVPPLQVP